MRSGCTSVGAHAGAEFFGSDKNDINDMLNLSNMSILLVF